MKRWFRTGRSIMVVAAAWNIFDAMLHVAIDQVEPPRIAGNVAAIAAVAIVHLVKPGRIAGFVAALAAALVLGFNAAWWFSIPFEPRRVIALVLIGVSLALLVWAASRFRAEGDEVAHPRWMLIAVGAALLAAAGLSFLIPVGQSLEALLYNDALTAADYWDDELKILSAGMGFDNIIGVQDDEIETVIEAGGSYAEQPKCMVAADGPLISTVTVEVVEAAYIGTADYDDGLPVVFSWPVLGSGINPDCFKFTLSNGEVVFPHAAGLMPNWELNARNVVVLFGDFGNRGRADEPDAVFPVKLEIVDDGSPLTFVGPKGQQSGVGLTWNTDATPYDSGPRLVGAKLNHVGDEAEGELGIGVLETAIGRNDEFVMYGDVLDRIDGASAFRLRILTTGCFSPDGLTGTTPDQFEDFFRLHVTGAEGETMLITDVGVDYPVAGGSLRVIGLSDLGRPEGDDVHYDDCYREDADNYIDIIIVDDDAAARSITHLEIPAEGDYIPFYNPGGPGLDPLDGVRYTAPGPPDLEPVIIALDDPMRVSHP